ncbi:MAG: hypothetical protein AAF542_18025 [Pseudomonadota bacterium]
MTGASTSAGSFAVFGVTWTYARQRATKLLELEKDLEREEYDAKFRETTEEVFNTSKPVRVSHTFDAPQFAEAFVELAKRTGEGRDLIVRARIEDKEKAPSKKTGKQPTKWVAWHGDSTLALI